MTNREYIEMLKKRDKAMPMKKYIPVSDALDPFPLCPVCGRMFFPSKSEYFCPDCGQRIDATNWEL